MDPFLEFQLWDEFHSALIYDVADTLVPQVRPNYVVRRERRVYVETDPDDPDRYLIPDATIAKAAKDDRNERIRRRHRSIGRRSDVADAGDPP